MEYKTSNLPLNFPQKSPEVNVEQLHHELKNNLKGEVRFDDGTRAMYATDASNYRQVPIGVVIPANVQDIITTTEICRKYEAPLLSRGGGTSLAGQCCNVAVVMDMSKYYNQVLSINKELKLASVQPGIVLDELNKQAQKVDLIFGPDPSTHSHCTLGGMIGNNSCGVHSVMSAMHGLGARTSDNLHSMEVLTYDGLRMTVGKTSEEELHKLISEGGRKGEIYKRLKNLVDKYGDEIRKRYPKIPRRVSGYNLDELLPENGFNVARALAGTEGTCVIFLNATLHLLPNPGARSVLILGYPDIVEAGAHAHELLKFKPIGLEGFDHLLYDYMVNRHMHVQDLKLLPEGKGWLFVEFGGKNKEDADNQLKQVMEALKKGDNPPSMIFYDDPEQEHKLWRIREAGLGATAFVPGLPDAWEGWEDTAVHPEKLGDYLSDFTKLLEKYNYHSALYGHFGQGLLHCRINFDLETSDGIMHYRNYLEEASDLVVRYNGSFSGEHGDGQSKAELLPKMYGNDLIEAFREFKSIWDPKGLMNPGKVSDPYPIVSNLRLGVSYNPAEPETYFKFPEDKGSFSRAVLRCVGVGECRKHNGGTMCPSYMVTMEEQHSTRGRAHKLFEMLRGEVIQNSWKDESVKEALDLCLACKGCKGDCPVRVDMATYKAEFLTHYYKGKIRPLSAYLFGRIAQFSRFAMLFPGLSNTIKNSSIIGSFIKKITGIASERKVPDFADESFKKWFFKRDIVNQGKPIVILWADTFNNFFHPHIAIAATEVLEYLGFQVKVFSQPLCCGRPLYDFGMLDTAQKWLLELLEHVKDDVRKGVSIVGLEPSCVSVFRDELINLFPNNDDANRVSQNTFMLSEFLEKKVKDYSFPRLKRKAIIHGHCHHKSIIKMKDEISVLNKIGLDCNVLDAGCCGMAGSFGFEEKHYKVSVAAGERVLLPEVRKVEDDTLIVMNGFSCKEQVAQLADKSSFHLAEILKMAIETEKPDKVRQAGF